MIKTLKVGDEEFPVVGYAPNGVFEKFYYKVEVDGGHLFTEVFNVSVNDDRTTGVLVKGALRLLK